MFFDDCGIRYEYEPQGFEVYGYKYLPDFYLPDYDIYVEVKPSKTLLLEEGTKISWMIDYQNTPISKGLLILGQIPYYKEVELEYQGVPQFPVLSWAEGVSSGTACFIKTTEYEKATIIKSSMNYDYSCAPNLPDVRSDGEDLWSFTRMLFKKDKSGFLWQFEVWQMHEAARCMRKHFLKARQARFEHGETPVIKTAKFN